MIGLNTQNNLDYSALLDRRDWTFNETKIDEHLAGKRVLITGAGGSIGSAVARRVSRSDVESLKLVDNSEISLFRLMKSGAISSAHSFQAMDAFSRQMERLIKTWAPDIIIHTAAFKHVGLMESSPESAYYNNTIGTVKLGRWAKENGVGQFLFISTDKAVSPTCYMGASKRLAEAWLLTQARDITKVCRFGNVLGSSGSLVEIVVENLTRGLPVTITDPNMERYFITPDEAVGLILSSAQFDGPGPFTIEMGQPVNIPKLIHRIANQLDLPLEVEMGFPGAGEKLSEQLLNIGETRKPTLHQGIFSLESPSFSNVSHLIQSVGNCHLDMIEATHQLAFGVEDCSFIC